MLHIKSIMDEIRSPILYHPGINYRMGAMIIAEIGDFSRFSSPDKILAYAGLSPSTYQSGQLDGCYSHMEKRGSVTSAMRCLMRQNLSAFGIISSLLILQRSVRRQTL
ncbi:MAG: transposase [[Ruminococcus] torques]